MMSQKNREPGFYWVKIYSNDKFEVARFAGSGIWYLNGTNATCEDDRLWEIDERRVTREEPTK